MIADIWPLRSAAGPWTAGVHRSSPLEGLRVLDFSGLLPGPLATLLMAHSGATVVKVERPDAGDGLRQHPVDFEMLNDGKHSLAADLKDPGGRKAVWALAETADVVVEQFRPGVMARLGFGFEHVAERNPSVVYCSITGYGQTGARSNVAGHDLNYIGHAGMLSLLDYGQGAALPPALVADVGGGSYPAFINVLLALMSRTPETPAVHLDIAMTDNVFPFMYWALACNAATLGPASHRLTGGSPRYRTYRTRDDRLLLVAALEPHFWARFCQAIDLPQELQDDQDDPTRVVDAIESIVRGRDADEWMTLLEPWDCCASIAATVAEAWQDRALHERGVLTGSPDQPALPLPIVPALRTHGLLPAPDLGDLAWSTTD